MVATKTERQWGIRWIVQRDLPAVLEIERASFDHPWSEADFMSHLLRRNSIGLVVTDIMSFEPAAYGMYELRKNHIEIVNMAVRPDCRRLGCGSLIVAKLVQRLSTAKRRRIVLRVSEANLGAHLFFQASGFRATKVARRWYDTGADAYVFQYDINPISGIFAARAAITVR